MVDRIYNHISSADFMVRDPRMYFIIARFAVKKITTQSDRADLIAFCREENNNAIRSGGSARSYLPKYIDCRLHGPLSPRPRQFLP
jgi:hypothetical protein